MGWEGDRELLSSHGLTNWATKVVRDRIALPWTSKLSLVHGKLRAVYNTGWRDVCS